MGLFDNRGKQKVRKVCRGYCCISFFFFFFILWFIFLHDIHFVLAWPIYRVSDFYLWIRNGKLILGLLCRHTRTVSIYKRYCSVNTAPPPLYTGMYTEDTLP